MNDKEFEKLLDAYMTGELEGPALEAFERALEENPERRAVVESHRRLESLIRNLPAPEPPPSLKANVLARVRAEKQASRAQRESLSSSARRGTIASWLGTFVTRWQTQAFAAACLVAVAAYGVLSRISSPVPETMREIIAAPRPTERASREAPASENLLFAQDRPLPRTDLSLTEERKETAAKEEAPMAREQLLAAKQPVSDNLSLARTELALAEERQVSMKEKALAKTEGRRLAESATKLSLAQANEEKAGEAKAHALEEAVITDSLGREDLSRKGEADSYGRQRPPQQMVQELGAAFPEPTPRPTAPAAVSLEIAPASPPAIAPAQKEVLVSPNEPITLGVPVVSLGDHSTKIETARVVDRIEMADSRAAEGLANASPRAEKAEPQPVVLCVYLNRKTVPLRRGFIGSPQGDKDVAAAGKPSAEPEAAGSVPSSRAAAAPGGRRAMSTALSPTPARAAGHVKATSTEAVSDADFAGRIPEGSGGSAQLHYSGETEVISPLTPDMVEDHLRKAGVAIQRISAAARPETGLERRERYADNEKRQKEKGRTAGVEAARKQVVTLSCAVSGQDLNWVLRELARMGILHSPAPSPSPTPAPGFGLRQEARREEVSAAAVFTTTPSLKGIVIASPPSQTPAANSPLPSAPPVFRFRIDFYEIGP